MTTATHEWEAVIGMEVHAELETASKMFCTCAVVDNTVAMPNTATCAICTAMPGVLPVINQQALDYAMMVGLALNCEIPDFNIFARKNYFYPDLPKGYQISQYEYPLAINGWIDIDLPNGTSKRIRIRRAHLEEDTGKLTHLSDGTSLVDYNRAGVPLLEIVTEPDIQSADEAEAYARKLRTILQYLGVNSGDMSKGVLRVEANISVRPVGSDELRSRTEVKNLNSIRNMYRATAYEIERQIKVWEAGDVVRQETMGWNEQTQKTFTQRSKEYAEDYRYFPEPDLPVIQVSREWVERVQAMMPELPDTKRQRFTNELGLSAYDAGVLISDQAIADYFEAAVATGSDAKTIANWITVEIFRLMNKDGLEREEIGTIKVTPDKFVALIDMVNNNLINNNTAKKVLATVYETGADPVQIVKDEGLAQQSDEGVLLGVIAQILEDSPDEVQRWLDGEEKVSKFLMGQVMRALHGKGNAQIVSRIIDEELAKKRQ